MTNLELAIVLFSPIAAMIIGLAVISITFKLDQDTFDDEKQF